MSKEISFKKKISKVFPIIFTIIHIGGLLLSSLFFLVGVMATGSGSEESKTIGTLIMLTPGAFLFGLWGIWAFWSSENNIFMVLSFLTPALWWGFIFLVSWSIGF